MMQVIITKSKTLVKRGLELHLGEQECSYLTSLLKGIAIWLFPYPTQFIFWTLSAMHAQMPKMLGHFQLFTKVIGKWKNGCPI